MQTVRARVVTSTGLAILLLSVAGRAEAQPAETRAYASGGLVLSWQEGTTTDEGRTYREAPGIQRWSLIVLAAPE